MLMTADEWIELLEFYEDTLKDGSLSFDFPDPDDSSSTIPVVFAREPALTGTRGSDNVIRIDLERLP